MPCEVELDSRWRAWSWPGVYTSPTFCACHHDFAHTILLCLWYWNQYHQNIITPHACTRGKAIGFVCLSSSSSPQKSLDLEIQASERLVSTTNLSKSAKNWLQYPLNRLIWPTSVANNVFMLATPINHTNCWPRAFCSCTQLAKYMQVKVVNK